MTDGAADEYKTETKRIRSGHEANPKDARRPLANRQPAAWQIAADGVIVMAAQAARRRTLRRDTRPDTAIYASDALRKIR
ncbi:hypothetical protein PSP6_970004 [Paraburkholderia tropica]|nr:hypothetical protein PSP6_970004 [Paraburkholderia tropica]